MDRYDGLFLVGVGCVLAAAYLTDVRVGLLTTGVICSVAAVRLAQRATGPAPSPQEEE